MKIIYNKIIPFQGYKYINLFGFLFSRTKNITPEDLNHECIHTAQMREMLYIFFYIWYIIEWIIRFLFTWKDPYRKIRFEREAYNNQDNLNYLNQRKHYCWLWQKKEKDSGLVQK